MITTIQVIVMVIDWGLDYNCIALYGHNTYYVMLQFVIICIQCMLDIHGLCNDIYIYIYNIISVCGLGHNFADDTFRKKILTL